ncbi:hypothetical protein [Limimaricola pyoseonensis]|uniref:Uncharacterized protein n=1 Tax=Limimaricola pyoseonensis TaxID=521013 RepID=A0A1G7A7S0_9RHOB|nr:hypothetical protein [Limimaricola pyoseonensis]SDE10537.1 hypothetical protein SAMN04488567_0838 [Limimaricola pyoseonensis]
MARELKLVIDRSRDTLLSDALGVASLVALLFVGLCLPGLV